MTEEGRTLVTDGDGRPLLWLDGNGALNDRIGIYCDPVADFGVAFSDLEELALLVGEWIWCASASGGMSCVRIHARLARRVLYLIPGRVDLCPDEEFTGPLLT